MTATTRPDVTDSTIVRVTGGRPLTGRVQVQGGKNIALHLYAATLLCDHPVTLTGAPGILDTAVCADILRVTGAAVDVTGGRFTVAPASILHPVIDACLGRRVRTTPVLAAAVLARTGRVTFPEPGGDAFCARLIDRHLAAMRAAGAEVVAGREGITAVAGPRGLLPFTVDVNTPFGPSLGATVSAMLLAARIRGTSLITTPSAEPEVIETARFLAARGVVIARDGEGLHVQGGDGLGGGEFAVAGDRVEAATLIMAAAATGGGVHLDTIRTGDIPAGLTATLAAAGVRLTEVPGGGVVTRNAMPPVGVEAHTGPHPGLPTDTAPQLAALLTQAAGVSSVTEHVYPSRDTHVPGLRALGADITTDGPVVRLRRSRLRGADVEAADIRAVTALLIGALAAEGTSTLRGMYHLRRGYGRLLPHLVTLGADIAAPSGDHRC